MGSQVDLTLKRNMQGGRGSGQSCGNQYSPFVRTGSVGGPLTTLLSIAAHFCQVKIHPKNMNHCFPNTDLQLDLLVSKTNKAVPVTVKHRRHYDSAGSVCVLHMACEITGKPIMGALKQLFLSGFSCWVRFLHSVVNGSPYSGAYLVLG